MQHLSVQELRRVFQAVTPKRRRRLMVKIAYWHGLRVSEVTGMRGDQIQGGHVWVKRLKGSEETIQPFARPMITLPDGSKVVDTLLDESEELAALAAVVAPDELLFKMTPCGFWRLMKRAGQKAKIPPFKKIRPHILKHSIAHHTLDRGVQINAVQKLLGHRSLSSTGEYTKLDDAQASVLVAKGMGLSYEELEPE